MNITKMHGLGNDFILTQDKEDDLAAAAKTLCRRRLSIGADGLIVVFPSDVADIRMRIYNADGSEAEMCGNGIRCFARYVYDKGLVRKTSMTVETGAGIMQPKLITENGVVTGVCVDMGIPTWDPAAIPVSTEEPLYFSVDADGEEIICASILMGVPHTVVFVDKMPSENEIARFGPAIEQHSIFPKKTNVDFAQVVSENRILVRTWERGAGRTMACGTGSCAVAVLANRLGLTGRETEIVLDAGSLFIALNEENRVFMTGPAAYVFEGKTDSSIGY